MAFLRTAGMVPLYSGGDEQEGVGLVRRDAQRFGGGGRARLAVEVLVVEGHLAEAFVHGDLDTLRRDGGRGLGEAAIDGGGAQAADESENAGLGHGSVPSIRVSGSDATINGLRSTYVPGRYCDVVDIPLLPLAGDESVERCDAARNRRRLLEAASLLVAERGVDAVTMDAVAARAGVGKGTVFRRFGSRAGLMRALLDHSEQALQQQFLTGPPPLGPGADPVDRLVAFGRARIRLVEVQGEVLRAAESSAEARFNAPARAVSLTHIEFLLRTAGVDGDLPLLAQSLFAPPRGHPGPASVARSRVFARPARRRVGGPRAPRRHGTGRRRADGTVTGMLRTLGLSVLLTLAATTAACAGDGAATAPQDPAVLTGRAFVSTAVSGPPIPGGGPLVVEFPESGRIAATAGCNRSVGAVDLADGVLRADRLASTLMSCPPPIDGADTWLSDLFAAQPRWHLDGDVLTLDGGDVSVSLLDRTVADPDRPVVGTQWVLTELVTATAVSTSRVLEKAAPTLTVAADGTVSGSTGCNRFTGNAAVGDTALTFGPLATTRAACPDPELADIESAVLAVLSGEVRYTVEGAQMRLTAADGVTGLGYTAR